VTWCPSDDGICDNDGKWDMGVMPPSADNVWPTSDYEHEISRVPNQPINCTVDCQYCTVLCCCLT